MFSPAKPMRSRRRQQLRQRLRPQPQDREVEQPVDRAQALGLALPLMQPGVREAPMPGRSARRAGPAWCPRWRRSWRSFRPIFGLHRYVLPGTYTSTQIGNRLRALGGGTADDPDETRIRRGDAGPARGPPGFGPTSATQADPYPGTRPVTVVVAWAPGGSTDFVGRVVALQLSKELGGNVVVDNRPGASGTSAMPRSPAPGRMATPCCSG